MDLPKNTIRICIFCSLYQCTLAQLFRSTMRDLGNLQSCLSLLLERNFFFDKWIGDDSLLSILHSQYYHFVDVDKAFLNQHLLKIYIGSIKIFRHKEKKLKYQGKQINRAYFYYFTKKDTDTVQLQGKISSSAILIFVCYELAIKMTTQAQIVGY